MKIKKVFSKNKNIDADKSLISVVCREVNNVELIRMVLDISAETTTQRTDPSAQRIAIIFSCLN